MPQEPKNSDGRTTIAEVRELMALTGLDGDWRELADGHHRFLTPIGGEYHWWEATGKRAVRGTAEGCDEIVDAWDASFRIALETGAETIDELKQVLMQRGMLGGTVVSRPSRR